METTDYEALCERLETLAKVATPGPWCVHPHFAYVIPASHADRPIGGAEDDAYDLAHYAQEICALHHPDRHRPASETRATAAFIAAANPETVLALTAAIRTLVAERDGLREAGGSVVARWDTPLWKDAEPTAHVVNRLRAALSGRNP